MSNSAFTPSTNYANAATPSNEGLVNTGAQTFGGEKTFQDGAVIKGITSGIDVTLSNIGYVLRDTTSAAANLSSTTQYVDLHSYLVPAGTWLVYGGVGIDNAASCTGADIALSRNSGNTVTDHVTGYNLSMIRVAANNVFTANIGPFLMNVASDTRVYLKGKAIGATTTSNTKSIWIVRIA